MWCWTYLNCKTERAKGPKKMKYSRKQNARSKMKKKKETVP
jgi:hypothetical protein